MSSGSIQSFHERLRHAGKTVATIDGIAAAAGPGLIGGVIVGLTTAKALALVAHKPLIAVNHLEAHALSARLVDNTPFPYCLFLASGGHTQIVAVRGVGDYERLGTTLDDAIGEAFDKTAKLLGLPYPGGPQVEKRAANGNLQRFSLPRPMTGRDNADFSLSGLKTAVRLEAENIAPLEPAGYRRPVCVVPARDCRCRVQPRAGGPYDFQSALWQTDRAGRRRRRCCERDDPAGARHGCARSVGAALWCRRRNCALTTAP